MGCGRVGSSLATELEAAGHTVSVIDQAREAFRRLGPDFKGRTVTGVGFDREVLLEAGIQDVTTQIFWQRVSLVKTIVFKMLLHVFMIQDVLKFISV